MDLGSLESIKLTPRFLVIDDESSILKIVKTILNRAHYEVTTCSSATEAMKFLAEEPFDCVITDVVMPEMSGLDLVENIRKDPYLGSLPILVLTRKRQRSDVKLAAEKGVTDYVLKPIDEHLLLDKVGLCLAKRNSKRHIFECSIPLGKAKAQILNMCTVQSLSESGLTVQTWIPIPANTVCQIDSPIFQEIGIKTPVMKVFNVSETFEMSTTGKPYYQISFAFLGVPEADLQKIRTWVHRLEIQRRK